jgi:hypothetical protein
MKGKNQCNYDIRRIQSILPTEQETDQNGLSKPCYG